MEFAVPLISGGFTAAKTALVLGMGPTPKNEAIANIFNLEFRKLRVFSIN